MRSLILGIAIALVATSALAQETKAPKFFQDTYPTQALDEALALEKALSGKDAALDAKTRELIGLAVAAQIPCEYCVYAHTKAARAAGATDAEIREAVATAAMTRHWSTVLNGMAYDFDTFKKEYDQMMSTN